MIYITKLNYWFSPTLHTEIYSINEMHIFYKTDIKRKHKHILRFGKPNLVVSSSKVMSGLT